MASALNTVVVRAPLRALRVAMVRRDVLWGSVRHVATTEPVFALTVDDGPDDEATPEILDALAAHRARGTFFVLSQRVQRRPDLVQQILSRGHEIALHGARHERMGNASIRTAYEVVWRGRSQLERVAGTRVAWFRPPHGEQNVHTYTVARLCGMEVVAWTAGARDWVETEMGCLEHHVARALSSLAPGGILLLHDGGPLRNGSFGRGELVDRLLTAAEWRGLRPMTLGELVRGREVVRSPWFAGARVCRDP